MSVMRLRHYLQSLRQYFTGGRKARPAARAPRRLEVEGLEDRTVPATLGVFGGALTYTAFNNVANNLTISHDAATNRYTFTDAGEGTIINLGGLLAVSKPSPNSISFSDANITSLVANLGNLNDSARVTGVRDPLTLNAGDGNDTTTVDLYNFFSTGIAAPVTVHGGFDTDKLNVRDFTAVGSHDSTISATYVNHDSAAPIFYDSIQVLNYTGNASAESITVLSTAAGTTTTVNAGDGMDLVHVRSTAAGSQTIVNGGDEDDALHVGTNQSLDTIQGALTLNGGAGANHVIALDNSSSVGHTYTFNPLSLTRDGMAPINYSNLVLFQFWTTHHNDNVTLQTGQTSVFVHAEGGNDRITVQGLGFGTFNTVHGDDGNDTIALLPASIQGSLTVDGQGGTNTLSYAAYTTDVTVNLPLGTATDIAGGVSNIQNVVGGSGNDVLVGDAQANLLVGNAGRDILIGGAGADVLGGRDGEDILIGGTTDYDLSPAALSYIQGVWANSNLSYVVGVALVTDPYSAYPLRATTVHGDGAADTLTGAAGLDLFFADALDTTDQDLGIGEVLVPVV
jgi:Ca2+-binding RTX toxin-like protein